MSTREMILKAWRQGCPVCGSKSALRRRRETRGAMVVDVLDCKSCSSSWIGEELPASEMLGLDAEPLLEDM